ncbi:hypothetical protein GGS26DRAFT_592489 [Hypomontagnella submonticulosa]|nr:hypothetical protein GGS26DRAFT_592489 [Hypomontagnella submonticulosa]
MSLKAIAIAWACAVLTQGVAADFDSCTNLLPRWDGSAWVFRRSFCINEAYDMWIVTALNLSQCYTLDDGKIVAAANKAPGIDACVDCYVGVSSIMYCSCPADNGTMIGAQTRLPDTIHNDDGYLACFDQRSTFIESSPYPASS